MKKTSVSILFLFAASLYANAQSGFKVTKKFPVGGSGGWDYITVAENSNHLYVTHATVVNVLDKTTGDSIGIIPNTTGVHGVALDEKRGIGYVSNGKLNTVTVFGIKENNVIKQIPVGENPDAILYDPYTDYVVTCNGRSKNLTFIDAKTQAVISTVEVNGKPETAVTDGKGTLFVNIEDKNLISKVDLKTAKVTASWPLAPGDGPAGLAIDIKNKRLFAGCEKLLVVVDATDGHIVDKLPIGDGCDGVAFDPALKEVFASNGQGTMTVIQASANDSYKVLENVPTQKGARTLAVDTKKHIIYTLTADFDYSRLNAKGRPTILAGSMKVLVLEKKK